MLTIFLLTTQVTSTEGHLNTYNIHIWHKLQKSMFGGVRKESFVLTSFVDSDQAWLKSFMESGEKRYIYKHKQSVDSAVRQERAKKNKNTEVCNCPPALSTWDCDQKEYRAIMSGQLCAFYRDSKNRNAEG